MTWKIRLNPKKHDGDKYTITTSVIESPKEGVYGDWDSPHDTWENAKAHVEEKLEAGDSKDTIYEADGEDYSDYKEALKNLTKPE